MQGRLAHARARSFERPRGETVAVAAGASLSAQRARLIASATDICAGSVTALDRSFSFAGALAAADDLISAHATVLLPAELDPEWLTRHLTGTKLGIALGAGGAKGYAHVGVLQVLEEAGYVVDYVAGSSIGAIIGAYLALGSGAGEIDATLRRAFNAEAVAEI